MESAFQWESKMVFVRNWVEEVRTLASKWKFEGHNRSIGNDLEFQADYLSSLLDLMWEEVQEADSASSQEISSYMSEMTNWISKVHLQRYSAKKDVLVPLKSSAMVCNGAPDSPAYQVFDEILEPIDDSEMSLNAPELLSSMNASSKIYVSFEARESVGKGGMVPLRLPEEVHHQTEVQIDTPIFPSMIAISAPPCPSSSLSSTTTFRSKDPIDLESIIQNSLSIYEAHSAIKTENNGLLSAGEAFTVISTLDGVSPFFKGLVKTD